MAVEEAGEFLDVLGKARRDRAEEEEVAEEAADLILTAFHACACEGIPLPSSGSTSSPSSDAPKSESWGFGENWHVRHVAVRTFRRDNGNPRASDREVLDLECLGCGRLFTCKKERAET
jgi:hypothetical protein